MTITSNILEFFNDIGQHWTRKRGLYLALVLEFIILTILWEKRVFPSSIVALMVAFGLALIIFVVWLITSKRILFRSGGLVVLWLFLSTLGAAAFYYFVYDSYCKITGWDIPYIHIWGSLAVFLAILFIGLVLDCFVFKGKKLIIVFAVNNESVAVEKNILSSVDPVVERIQDEDSKVRLVVLPFGVIKSVRKSAGYIKMPLTRADAIIFASVVDGSENTPAEYVFTDFSSRINERRFIREEHRGTMHMNVLDANLRYKEWNFINSANDNCSRKIAISKNLDDMLRMYIGCIYLMKHDFESAIPYTNNAINGESRNSPLYGIASMLYSYSILSSARVLENDRREYDAALNQLNQLNKRMPFSSSDPGYNKAMARVMYYKGDIKTSESYTRKFKDLPDHRWGYELNMGFYAMNKKKTLEFAQHYKNLRKYYPLEDKEVNFAIRFLERQERETNDSEYRTLLQIAIAYLYVYKDSKKAKKLMKKTSYTSTNAKFNKAINDLQEIIFEASQTFDIMPGKKN